MLDKYTNTLLQIPLTATQIEEQISDYPIKFYSLRNAKIEGYTKAPLFLYSFYSFLINEGVIPTQEQFWEHYVERAKEWLEENGFLKSHKNLFALKARAYRAYPSFIRDIHFAKMLEETKKYQVVFYNETLDVKDGIDIVVQKNNKLYCIRLHIQTARSAHWKKEKDSRHSYNDVNDITIAINFKKAKVCGGFFLCSNDDLLKVESFIVKKERTI